VVLSFPTKVFVQIMKRFKLFKNGLLLQILQTQSFLGFADVINPLFKITHLQSFLFLIYFEWTKVMNGNGIWNKLLLSKKSKVVWKKLPSKADFSKPFHLHIDASNLAIGCVLSQPYLFGPKIIICCSNKLSPAESKYAISHTCHPSYQASLSSRCAHKVFTGSIVVRYFRKKPITLSLLQPWLNHWLKLFFLEERLKLSSN